MSVPNKGSTARDFCFLERNILSHLKLALLLSLLSSSSLLHARLPSPDSDSDSESSHAFPVACIQFAAALAAIGAGLWQFWSGDADLRSSRAFLVASKYFSSLFPIICTDSLPDRIQSSCRSSRSSSSLPASSSSPTNLSNEAPVSPRRPFSPLSTAPVPTASSDYDIISHHSHPLFRTSYLH